MLIHASAATFRSPVSQVRRLCIAYGAATFHLAAERVQETLYMIPCSYLLVL